MSSVTIKSEFSPGVLSLLPLFYVGWSDTVLSPSEIKLIHDTLETFDFLSSEDKLYLKKYTDPKNPPSGKIFKSWLRAIKNYSGDMPDSEKSDLVKLGLKMALSGASAAESIRWGEPHTKKAITDLAKALKVDSSFNSDLLTDKLTDNKAKKELRSFDPAKMKVVLDGEYVELRDRLRHLLRDPLFTTAAPEEKDEYRILTLKRVKALADQGLSSFSFPKKYGGYEKEGEHMVVFEMLAYSDLSMMIKFGVQFGLFGGALYMLGTEKHCRKYLEPMHRGELLGCFAMTETGHGSNVKGLNTTANYHEKSDQICIHSPDLAAGKEYIGNALHSSMAVVFAQLYVGEENHGVHAVLVPLRDATGKLLKGIKIEDCGHKLGLNGVDNGRIWFDNVMVPRENLLDKYGTITREGVYLSSIDNPSARFFTMLGALVVGRICVASASINASKKAITIAIKYANKRRQFGPSDEEPENLIMDYPTHQERLIPKLASVYAYHFALVDLKEQYVKNDGAKTRQIETLAAGLKAKSTWLATELIQECREACGGKGYLSENQIDALKADTDIFTTFEGDNTVLMQLVAKGLLTEYNQSFHDGGLRSVISYLVKKAKYKLKEYDSFTKGNTDYSHLISDEFLQSILQYRYEKHLISLGDRMKKYLERHVNPYQAFLKTQIHMVDLADTYVDHFVGMSMRKHIDQQDDIQVRHVLLTIWQLHTLDVVYRNRGWYLENDIIGGEKSKAIRRARQHLIQLVNVDALALVNSFAIPDELVAAPIALE